MHLLHGCQTGDLGPGQASNWSTTQGPRTEDKLQEQSVLPSPIQPCLRRPYSLFSQALPVLLETRCGSNNTSGAQPQCLAKGGWA